MIKVAIGFTLLLTLIATPSYAKEKCILQFKIDGFQRSEKILYEIFNYNLVVDHNHASAKAVGLEISTKRVIYASPNPNDIFNPNATFQSYQLESTVKLYNKDSQLIAEHILPLRDSTEKGLRKDGKAIIHFINENVSHCKITNFYL